jgi:hypothetical protein
MTPSTALSVLLPALVAGALAVVTADELSAIHAGAAKTVAEVQARNDAQTLEAARVLYEMSGGPAEASAEELVAHGYLKPSWLTRERVAVPEPVNP